MGCEISTAGDIYSYGVILLEMITGKHPTNDMFKDGLNLHNFVENAFPHNICEILDSSLIPFHDTASHDNEIENQTVNGIQNCIKRIAQLGLMCFVDSPKDQPAIQDVYTEIIAIKEMFLESQR
jgi:serine/threonine protein kinase